MPSPVASLHDLNARFCDVVGCDPANDAGFRLTVLGGFLPVLERFELPAQGSDQDGVGPAECIVHRSVLVPKGDLDRRLVTADRKLATALNVELCDAFGVPTTAAGFRLTVLGGELPALEVFTPPPTAGGALSDQWVAALEQAAARSFTVEPAASDAAMAAVADLDAEPVGEDVTEPVPERHTTPVAPQRDVG
jgi:hypothetical protein